MKKLIFIGGTMGVGKTAVGQLLKKRLDRCVFLDGDWCWDMHPFSVTEETKKTVQDNISHLLNNFLACPEFDYVIFVWVMHEQSIIDTLLSSINYKDYSFYGFSLTASAETLKARLSKDISDGIRAPGIIQRSVARIPLYEKLGSEIIPTDGLSAADTAEILFRKITD